MGCGSRVGSSVLVALVIGVMGCGSDDSGGGAGTGGNGTGGNGSGGSGTGGGAGSNVSLEGCPIFPADNEWNRDVSGDEVDANSNAYIQNILSNGGSNLHPDFGSFDGYGIPYVVVEEDQAKVEITFDYDDESDPGPYPIPPDAPIEGGVDADGDRHVIVVQKGACMLWETFDSHYEGPGWHAGSGAKFDLKSNALRPDGWTSADAAGLPIFPGLVRYDEAVTAGEIGHALRFTVENSQAAYIHPATHLASDNTDPDAPPMGLRLRLKASFDTSGFTGAALVILNALKKYGMIMADNGSNWYISGTSHPSFDDDDLGQLKDVSGENFEVVKVNGTIYK
jgi:hypothetical protein